MIFCSKTKKVSDQDLIESANSTIIESQWIPNSFDWFREEQRATPFAVERSANRKKKFWKSTISFRWMGNKIKLKLISFLEVYKRLFQPLLFYRLQEFNASKFIASIASYEVLHYTLVHLLVIWFSSRLSRFIFGWMRAIYPRFAQQ